MDKGVLLNNSNRKDKVGPYWNSDASKYIILKELLTFSFASLDTIAAILLENNSEGLEEPIAFFRKNPRDSNLKYNTLEISKVFQNLLTTLKNYNICT